jgi:hypothetical protein
MRFTVKADLLQFADFFGHCISVREFDAGAMFTSIGPVDPFAPFVRC